MVNTTTRNTILTAARESGWTVTEFPASAWIDRGRRRILIEFSVRGGVTYASTEGKRITGTGKATAVLEEITR